jgi:hypothetical protein
LSNFTAELLKEIKRTKHLSLTKIGEVIDMSRQHITRERDKPGTYPEVLERLKREFKNETEVVKKLFPKLYSDYPVPNHEMQGSDLNYHTTNNKKNVQQEILNLQSDFADLRKKQQIILAQQKAIIEYTAKKDANGNPEVEKEILEKLTEIKQYPSKKPVKRKAKKKGS